MSLRAPLAKVKGLGASGHGSSHWWLQRVSALALIPLSLWFVFSVISHIGDTQAELVSWIANPAVALGLILYALFMAFHAQLGLQVVIEDYIHAPAMKMTLLLLNKMTMAVVAASMVFSVLRIAL